jgi:TPR repeat protein
MFDGVTEFTSILHGDSSEFMRKVQTLVVGVARDYEPARLYVIRIDNWFGPKWMHFAGKFTAGKGFAIGVHKTALHVPPFVPHRAVAERVFVGPNFDEAVIRPPLHIECTSELALTRRIADVDKEAAFVWFSSESEVQKRGSIMVYLPVATLPRPNRREWRKRSEAFYMGFSQRQGSWELAMLRGISRGEAGHLEESGNSSVDDPLSKAERRRLVDETKLLLEDDAIEWTTLEALWRPYVDRNDVDAQFHLADFYLDYYDEGPQKEMEMKDLLRRAANQGHADATYRLRQQYPEGAERDALLLKAGELGSLEAQRDLGALYATGDWTGPRDSVHAVEWYRRAAERGHPDAQYNLGFMCLTGEGVEANPNEGLRWLKRSADQGDECAIRLLADLYRNGKYGIPADAVEAQLWQERYRKTDLYRLREQKWGAEGAY